MTLRTANLDPANPADAPLFLHSIAGGPPDLANGLDVATAIGVVADMLRQSPDDPAPGFVFVKTYEYSIGKMIRRLARVTGEKEPAFGLPVFHWIESVGANLPQGVDAAILPGTDADRFAFAQVARGWCERIEAQQAEPVEDSIGVPF